MKIHGYQVFDCELILDGTKNLIQADRPCDCCFSSSGKLLKASLEGYWEEVIVCEKCMVQGGLFLSYSDLRDVCKNQ